MDDLAVIRLVVDCERDRSPPAWAVRLEAKIEQLLRYAAASQRWEEHAMAAIDDLEAKVAQVETVEGSAIALIQQIAQMLRDAGTDPARLAAVIQSLDSGQQRLADAVVANTPATA
jgi:hypothetical protein